MSSSSYTTTDGDVLDEICHRIYGDTTMLVPVLDANPHLADNPPVLPAGIVIILPEKQTPVIKTKRLWE